MNEMVWSTLAFGKKPFVTFWYFVLLPVLFSLTLIPQIQVEKRGQLLYTNNMGHESNCLMNNQLSHFINRSGFVNKILPLKLTIRTIVFGGWFGHHVESTSKQMCRSNKLGFECSNVTVISLVTTYSCSISNCIFH